MANVSKNSFKLESLSILPLLGLHYFGFQAKGFGLAALVSEVATQIFSEKEFSSERFLKKAVLLSLGYLAVKEKSIDFNGLEASFAGLFLIACQNNDLGTSCSGLKERWTDPYSIICTSGKEFKCGYYALAIGIMQKDSELRQAVYNKLGLTEEETQAIERCVTSGNFKDGQFLLGDKVFAFFAKGDGKDELAKMLEMLEERFLREQINNMIHSMIHENVTKRTQSEVEAILRTDEPTKQRIFKALKSVKWRERGALNALEQLRTKSTQSKEREISQDLEMIKYRELFKDYLSSKISDYHMYGEPNEVVESLINQALPGSDSESKRSDSKKTGGKPAEGEEWQLDDVYKMRDAQKKENEKQTFINVERLKSMATILGLEVKVFPDRQTNGQNEICLIGPTSEERQNEELVCIALDSQHYSAIDLVNVPESS